MRANEHRFVGFTVKVGDEIMRRPLRVRLLQCDLRRPCAIFHHRKGILDMNVNPRNPRLLINGKSDLSAIDIRIRKMEISVAGDNPQSTVLDQLIIELIANAAVHQNDTPLAFSQRAHVPACKIIEGRVNRANTCTVAALAGDLLTVNRQTRHLVAVKIDREGLKHRSKPQRSAFFLQKLRATQFLGTTARSDVRSTVNDAPNVLAIHFYPPHRRVHAVIFPFAIDIFVDCIIMIA